MSRGLAAALAGAAAAMLVAPMAVVSLLAVALGCTGGENTELVPSSALGWFCARPGLGLALLLVVAPTALAAGAWRAGSMRRFGPLLLGIALSVLAAALPLLLVIALPAEWT